MHSSCWMLLPVVVLVTSGASAASAQEQTFDETVNLEPGGMLSLESTRGTVRLTAWDRQLVEIHARIEPPAEFDDDHSRRAVEETTIDVEGNDQSVRIRSKYGDVGLGVPAVHFEIRAPRNLALDLDLDRNTASVHGFDGRIALHADRSNLDTIELSGEISIDLDRGQLNAREVAGHAAFKLGRAGRVMLNGLRGSFEFDLDHTSVTMRNVTIDDDSQVKIDRGNLDIELNAGQTLTIEASVTRRANFSSDLPITMREGGREYRGEINGGGPRLQIEADRSQISLDISAQSEWAQWGGPNRDFVVARPTALPSWSGLGPALLWSREFGPGYSAIVSDGERLYTMTRRGADEVVVAMSADTGATIWEHAYLAPAEASHELDTTWGSGPNGTPLVSEGRLYTLGFTGVLRCLDTATGELVWGHNLSEDLDVAIPFFGYSASPIRYQDTLIVIGGGALAFRLEDGSLLWKNREFEGSYASPVLFQDRERIRLYPDLPTNELR